MSLMAPPAPDSVDPEGPRRDDTNCPLCGRPMVRSDRPGKSFRCRRCNLYF